MSQTIQSPNLPRVIEEFGAVFRNKGMNPPPLSWETALDGSLGLESLDFAELVVRLEQTFGKDPFSEGTSPGPDARRPLAALRSKNE